jgi:hypothetical protein
MVSDDHVLLGFPEAESLRALAWLPAPASATRKPSRMKAQYHGAQRDMQRASGKWWERSHRARRSLHSQKRVSGRFCRPFQQARVS